MSRQLQEERQRLLDFANDRYELIKEDCPTLESAVGEARRYVLADAIEHLDCGVGLKAVLLMLLEETQ